MALDLFRRDKMHLGHSRVHDGVHAGARRVIATFCSTRDALCEVQCEGQGDFAKCICCFGLNGDFGQ
jgi:hypothetical protein